MLDLIARESLAVELERKIGKGSGLYGMSVELGRRAAATRRDGQDHHRFPVSVLEQQTLPDDLALTHASQIDRIARHRVCKQNRSRCNGLAGTVVQRRAVHAADGTNDRHEKKNRLCHPTLRFLRNIGRRATSVPLRYCSSRPRPDFRMRPSAVSSSTILSSTPLMKTLLPGVL